MVNTPNQSTPSSRDRLPVSGEKLWTTTVHPSLAGSGALPPNPTFRDEPATGFPTPNLDALLEAFSTPVDLDRIAGTFP